MPTVNDLVAHNKNHDAIARELGADLVIFQQLDDLVKACQSCRSAENICALASDAYFDVSVFNGEYVTGDVTEAYLRELDVIRGRRNESTVSFPCSPVDEETAFPSQNDQNADMETMGLYNSFNHKS